MQGAEFVLQPSVGCDDAHASRDTRFGECYSTTSNSFKHVQDRINFRSFSGGGTKFTEALFEVIFFAFVDVESHPTA